ncbi:MAG: cyclase family protein [bacterium]|nr:cyclase family protein [Acidimicrobiia bacterium]MCY4649984.1 cyclase family protein [bacterium]
MPPTDWATLREGRVIDLAQSWHRGMPVSPNHPAFQMALMRRHGDMVRPDGGSAANEMIVLGGHVGTHIDALCHVSHEGLLHGGIETDPITTNNGFTQLGIETVPPFFCRGVLLDVARVHGVDHLPAGYEITVSDLVAAQEACGTELQPGDVALVHSGWNQFWDDPEAFRGQIDGAPGPGEEAGNWLAQKKIRAAGAETIAFEVIRPGAGHSTLPVHRQLLVESGIYIFEAMNLGQLATLDVGEFLFIASPLKLVGATGSPIRPLAIVFD